MNTIFKLAISSTFVVGFAANAVLLDDFLTIQQQTGNGTNTMSINSPDTEVGPIDRTLSIANSGPGSDAQINGAGAAGLLNISTGAVLASDPFPVFTVTYSNVAGFDLIDGQTGGVVGLFVAASDKFGANQANITASDGVNTVTVNNSHSFVQAGSGAFEPFRLDFAISDFTGVDFSSLTSLTLELSGVDDDYDARYDFIGTFDFDPAAAVPVPSAIMLFVAGLLGFRRLRAEA